MSRTILFVDDEPRIIDGIKRMLRPLRDEWEVLTATSGPQALEMMGQRDIDVVISDMRMPGMDGAELLDLVMRSHPNVVRIILSGQSDSASIMRSIGPTHQYLSKPCAPEVLRATLARACTLRDLLRHERLAGMISRLSSLPSQPDAYGKVITELEAKDPSLPRIAELIASDMGMSAKILQLVNFSLFRGGHSVASPLDAAMSLGLDNIRSLVLTVRVFEQAGEVEGLASLWKHGQVVGTMAKAIALAENRPPDEAEVCFTAGMLHDCGRLVLRDGAALTVDPAQAGQRLTTAERARFGAAHPEIGAYLLGLWGLPYGIVEAVAHHHHPEAFPDTGFTPLTAVHVAEAISSEWFPEADDGTETTINQGYIATIGLAHRLPSWRAAAVAQVPMLEREQ
jgi:HD-like signal output (HDOD) protein/CheY-like chemotaxis protein